MHFKPHEHLIAPHCYKYICKTKVFIYLILLDSPFWISSHHWFICFNHRENGGTLGMVPLVINPIYTLYHVAIYWGPYPLLKGLNSRAWTARGPPPKGMLTDIWGQQWTANRWRRIQLSMYQNLTYLDLQLVRVFQQIPDLRDDKKKLKNHIQPICSRFSNIQYITRALQK